MEIARPQLHVFSRRVMVSGTLMIVVKEVVVGSRSRRRMRILMRKRRWRPWWLRGREDSFAIGIARGNCKLPQ